MKTHFEIRGVILSVQFHDLSVYVVDEIIYREESGLMIFLVYFNFFMENN